ncbi:MAG: PQQ-binding-like beta-propeller repeat protein [Planctomycetaceae bacterium]|nr:PQQ-binding-like beta-propeller repeat protein [Planctomycetaceae bacterium]
MFRTIALVAGLLALSSLAHADDWPHFRGPGYDNISEERGWSAEALSPEPSIAWRAEIGIGYSGPAVVGDAVYVLGYADGQEHVRRLNADTGDVVWTHSYPGAKIDTLNAGGPGATPTVVGDVVYTNGREGQVHCLKTADGAVVWSLKLPEAYEVQVPDWGFTTSPLLADGKLILDAGRLVALDPATGKEVWKSDKEHKPGYGTPTPFAFGGEKYLAHLNNDGLSVAKLSDGAELGFYKIDAQFDTAGTSPIVRDDTIWISVGYDGRAALLKFDGDSLKQVYVSRKIKNHFSNSIVIGDHIYGISGQTNHSRTCMLVCLEYATGELAWEQSGGGFGSLVAADGNLIYLNDVGTAAIIPANPEKFEFISKGDILDGQCWTAPVLANGKLYCRNSEGSLVVVNMMK